MEAPVANAYDLVDETMHWNPKGAVYFARMLEELFVQKFIDRSIDKRN